MDPVLKIWMFQNWIGDQKDEAELAKNHAYLLASFDHPEEVKKLMGEGEVHTSTDDEFEESSRMVRKANLQTIKSEAKKNKRRKRFTLDTPTK